MSIKHQVDINASETFKEKITFEREDKSQVVMINLYHTDNGIFDVSHFMEELLKKQQKIRFVGVSASHKNGEADRTTKTVVIMEISVLMQAWMIFHKDILSIYFGQHK